MLKRVTSIGFLLAALGFFSQPLWASTTNEQQEFIDMMVSKHQFDRDQVTAILQQAESN